MDYAAITLALLTGVAGGTAFTWWRLRRLSPHNAPTHARKSGATRADDEEIRRYRMANNAMQKLIDAERFADAYAVARSWCNRAPQFVESWQKLRGPFDLEEVPLIEYAAQHLVALRDVPGLRQLRAMLATCDELKPWQNLVADEIVAAKELDRIFDLVERNPGIAQDAAARRVEASARRAFSALHDAELRNLIRRQRNGGSYALYLE